MDKSVYTIIHYKLDPGHHTNKNISLNYNGRIFVGTYSSYSEPDPEPYPPGTQVRCRTPNFEPVQETVYSIPQPYTISVILKEDTYY